MRAPAKTPYPLGIVEADLTYPRMASGDALDYSAGEGGSFTLYEVETRRGSTEWVVCTLGIQGGRRSRIYAAERTYAVNLRGGVMRVGRGPHVKQVITVYVRKSRRQALDKLVQLHTDGLAQAGMIRDRIGSRRAQGQLMRAEGRTNWRWDS